MDTYPTSVLVAQQLPRREAHAHELDCEGGVLEAC